MNKVQGSARMLEKLFWVFLFINPFLDIINGVYINLIMGVGVLDVKFTSTLGVTPSLVLRMLMLLVFALYILIVRDKHAILTAIPIGVCWALSVASEYLTRGGAQIFIDVQYAARFCYNIVLLMVYSRVFAQRWGEDGKDLLSHLDDIAAFTLALLSFSILASAVVGIGYSTYADRMGYRGSRGFFYAGNDITAVLALLLPINVAKFMTMDRKSASKTKNVLYALSGALGGNALMIIGSKTAFIAVAVTYALMLVCAIVCLCKGRDKAVAVSFVWAAVAALGVFALLMLLSGMELWYSIVGSFAVTGELAENEGVETAILSGRQYKFSEHLAQFKEGGVLVWLFGLGRGSQEEILEMDVFEVLFYYGIAGFVTFLWLYAKMALDFFKSFLRRPGIMTAALFASLAMCAGYLFIAGHILFSVTSGFYFVFVILYSRAYFARNSKEILLWGCKRQIS
jgi:hypothetical protein